MKKLENLGRSLSTIEQKNIFGGIVAPDGNYGSCSCTQHVGTWTYTSCPTFFGMVQDIAAYCRGGANCSVQVCGL